MADRRLVWNQISAPDLSAAAAAVARANQSFNNGFETGAGILERYGAAQQAKADDAILAEIAGLQDEAAFDAFIDGGGLAGRNLSDNMRQHILGLRGGLVDIEGGRAANRQTDAQTGLIGANTNRVNVMTGIQSAREARTAADWMDGNNRRDAARALAGEFSSAQEFARNHGTTVGPITETADLGNTRLMLARTLQAEAGNQGYQGMLDVGSVIRNRAATGNYGDGVQGVIMRPGQFSAWNSVTGYAGGEQGQNMNFTPNEEALRAADAILSGQYQDRTGGATHYYANIPGVSGVPSWSNSSFRQIDGDHFFGRADGEGAIQGNTGPIAGSDPASFSTERASPVQAYRQALIETGLYTGPEINRMMADITGAGETRDAEVEARDAEILAERRAQAQIDALLDPNNLSGVDLGRDMLVDDRFTATENLGNLRAATGIAEANPGLLAPEVEADARVTGISQQISADLEAALASDNSQARLVDSIPTFANDPAGTLIEQLGIATDEQTPDYFQPEQVNRHINRIADEYGVTREVAAAAMREIYIRDPGDDEESSFWYDSDLTRNTVENRFPMADVGQIIEESLSNERVSGFRANRERAQAINQQVASINSQITRLQQQAAKGGDRTEIGQQIAQLMLQLSSIRSQNAELFGTPSQ